MARTARTATAIAITSSRVYLATTASPAVPEKTAIPELQARQVHEATMVSLARPAYLARLAKMACLDHPAIPVRAALLASRLVVRRLAPPQFQQFKQFKQRSFQRAAAVARRPATNL